MINEFQGKYRFLSNFWPCSVSHSGMQFLAVENAYQAAKCDNVKDQLRFLAVTPGAAKRLGRRVSLRPDWDTIKLSVMKNLVNQKFRNNRELGLQLLATGYEELLEGNLWGDTFWGVCNGIGENHLGRILMEIREELRDVTN